MYDEVEQHHKAKQHEDFIALGGNGEEEEESEEDEEGVFDLDVDTESSSGDDDDDDDEEEDEDEDEDEEEDSDDEPPKQQRRQASLSVERAGLLSDEEEEDEDEDEDEAAGARKVRQWGKHKQQYYNADATDLEIGQDFGDAEEEEAAAREVEQARYDEMDEEDYVDGLGGSDDGEEEEEEETLSARVKKQAKEGKEGKKAKAKAALAPLLGDLSLLQGGVDERGDVETARVRKDLSKLSKAGKLQVLITDSPELLTLLEEFKEKLGELRDRVEPLVPLARQVRKEGRREGGREGKRCWYSCMAVAEQVRREGREGRMGRICNYRNRRRGLKRTRAPPPRRLIMLLDQLSPMYYPTFHLRTPSLLFFLGPLPYFRFGLSLLSLKEGGGEGRAE